MQGKRVFSPFRFSKQAFHFKSDMKSITNSLLAPVFIWANTWLCQQHQRTLPSAEPCHLTSSLQELALYSNCHLNSVPTFCECFPHLFYTFTCIPLSECQNKYHHHFQSNLYRETEWWRTDKIMKFQTTVVKRTKGTNSLYSYDVVWTCAISDFMLWFKTGDLLSHLEVDKLSDTRKFTQPGKQEILTEGNSLKKK